LAAIPLSGLLEHDPEKWQPDFGKDYAPRYMIPKGTRLSEKIIFQANIWAGVGI
jgi:hypothetical protein